MIDHHHPVYGDEALKNSTSYEWYAQFKNSQESV
jgi:hypothetical protein